MAVGHIPATRYPWTMPLAMVIVEWHWPIGESVTLFAKGDIQRSLGQRPRNGDRFAVDLALNTFLHHVLQGRCPWLGRL
jgi:hypothetical protein